MDGFKEIRAEDGRTVNVPRLCLDYVPESMVALSFPIRSVALYGRAVTVAGRSGEMWVGIKDLRVVATASGERLYVSRWVARKLAGGTGQHGKRKTKNGRAGTGRHSTISAVARVGSPSSSRVSPPFHVAGVRTFSTGIPCPTSLACGAGFLFDERRMTEDERILEARRA